MQSAPFDLLLQPFVTLPLDSETLPLPISVAYAGGFWRSPMHGYSMGH